MKDHTEKLDWELDELPPDLRWRECLCLVADTSLSGARVARELSALIRIYGKPGCIVSDNVLCREILAA